MKRWLQLPIPKDSGSKLITSETHPRTLCWWVSLAPAMCLNCFPQSLFNSQTISGCTPHLSSPLPSLGWDLKASAISVERAAQAFSHLKSGKWDGSLLVSDYLIHALASSHLFFPSLTVYCNSETWLYAQVFCILVPIPKSSKDPTVSVSYCPVALSSTLNKALECWILLSFPNHFRTSGLQFVLKKNMSTSLYTGTIKNVIFRFCCLCLVPLCF